MKQPRVMMTSKNLDLQNNNIFRLLFAASHKNASDVSINRYI